MNASGAGAVGTMGGMTTTKRKRERKQPEPPRPTLADVDSWLAQIDALLADAPGAQRGPSR